MSPGPRQGPSTDTAAQPADPGHSPLDVPLESGETRNDTVSDGVPSGVSGGFPGSSSGSSGGGGAKPPQGEQPLGEGKTRCCRGLLYFSQLRLEQGKMPTCAGLRTTPSNPEQYSGLPPEMVPGGDFKFICMGYSVYDEAQLQRAWKDAAGKPMPPIAVPYCEGLEIVSSSDMAPAAPALLKEGDLDAAAGTGAATAAVEAARPRQPTFANPPPQLPTYDWSKFPERFSKTSGAIVDKMGTNASYIANSIKKSAQQLADDLFGRKDR